MRRALPLLLLLAACSKAPEPTPTPTPEAAVVPAVPPKPTPVPAPVDVAAPPVGVQITASGLASRVLSPGEGEEHPSEVAVVTVHYTGWTTDGAMFDSSRTRGAPATFPLNKVIAGWTEGLQLMAKGESRRFWIPEELAYKGRPGAPAGMLVFDVELLSWKEPPPPIPAPEDCAAPGAGASKEVSGLASRVLKAGSGTRHPAPTDRVKVHYTGWTKDGVMFDSSVQRGEPAVFPLNGVIRGWTEGVGLMVEGESRRFWIPGDLAYGDTPKRPGAPSGQLTFDVELIEIVAPQTAAPH